MESFQNTTQEEKITIDSLEESLDQNISEKQKNSTLDRVIQITKLMSQDTEKALDSINNINRKTEFLAINALIEASRAGDAGKGFQVVAESIDVLACKTKQAVEQMRKETISKMNELRKIIHDQSKIILGNRLSDLALTNIDLIDRNLYERTADVRWWATDDILVNALTDKSQESAMQASNRLSTILKSYTVYADLVLLDMEGNAIANGKPELFDLSGKNYLTKPWFHSAMQTSNGTEYGFQEVHKSSSSGMHTMTFSCKVHQNGDTNQKVVGVLAAVFDWDGLTKKVMNETPLNEDEKPKTRVCIVDKEGEILADTQGRVLSERMSFPKMEELFKIKKGFTTYQQNGDEILVAHAISQGYETYSSGWHSLIIQNLSRD